jgi:hypothetical protein
MEPLARDIAALWDAIVDVDDRILCLRNHNFEAMCDSADPSDQNWNYAFAVLFSLLRREAANRGFEEHYYPFLHDNWPTN